MNLENSQQNSSIKEQLESEGFRISNLEPNPAQESKDTAYYQTITHPSFNPQTHAITIFTDDQLNPTYIQGTTANSSTHKSFQEYGKNLINQLPVLVNQIFPITNKEQKPELTNITKITSQINTKADNSQNKAA